MIEFQCMFDLKKYPKLRLALLTWPWGILTWHPWYKGIEQSPDANFHDYRSEICARKVQWWDNDLKMMFLKRKVTTKLRTISFPMLLLTAIAFATTFFKPFFCEAALSLQCIAMLDQHCNQVYQHCWSWRKSFSATWRACNLWHQEYQHLTDCLSDITPRCGCPAHC